MACASYLQRREGRYSIQIRFSTPVAGLIGKPLYRASLKSTCYREARLRLVEVLAWFHRMNDGIDYPSLFAKNVRALEGYLKDEWPISSERLVARQRYEELLKNFRRRAEGRAAARATSAPASFGRAWAQPANAEGEPPKAEFISGPCQRRSKYAMKTMARR